MSDTDNRLTKDGEIEQILKASQTSYQVCQGESPVDSSLGRSTTKEEAMKKIKLGIEEKQNKWHKRFLNLATEIASWSKDPSSKCGSVIVDSKRRITSTGYNGLSRGVKDTNSRLNHRETKYDLTIHAEMNAVLFAKRDLSGHTLYVTPIPPCVRCATMIIQSGISRVVTTKLQGEAAERWADSVEKSKIIFDESDVEYLEI